MERTDCEKPQSVAINFKVDCLKRGRPKKRSKEVIDMDMKVRGLKRSDAANWRLGCRNWPTLTSGDNKPGSMQMMIGVK